MSYIKTPPYLFMHQPDALLNQAAPVADTWYDIFALAGVPSPMPDCRIIGIAVGVLVAGETLECRVTVDGVAITPEPEACNAATDYHAGIITYITGTYLQLDGANIFESYRAFLVEGRRVTVEVRKTTANGAGNLRACVMYARIP